MKQSRLYLLAALLALTCVTPNVAQNRGGNWAEGAWDGDYVEEMWETRSLRLIVEGDQYNVRYYDRDCEGSWSMIERGEKKMKFVETLRPREPDKTCPGGGEVMLELLDSTHLLYSYKPPNSKKTTLRVNLRRISMDIAKPPPPPQYEKTGHETSELLLERPKYKVYAPEYGSVCLYTMGVVSIVYDVPVEEPVDFSLETFMREVAPVVAQKCQGGIEKMDRFLVKYYLKNVWFFDAPPYVEEGGIERTEKKKSEPFIETQYHRRIGAREIWETGPPSGVIGSLAVTNYTYDNGRYVSSDVWSLSIYRRKLAEKKEADVLRAAKEEERRAEEARLAPIRAQERLKKEREANIASAAGVLRFYKRGAPEQYDFTGYETKDFMQSVYSGNFDPFTGGFRTYDDWRSDTIYRGFGNADVRNPLGFLLNLVDTADKASGVRARRDSLALSYYVYHITYHEQCIANREMPWGSSTVEFYQTNNEMEVPGSRIKGNVYAIREPFRSTFNDAYSALGSITNILPLIPAPLQNDFRKFLQKEGCASPAVRFFETNLYLATRWRLPLQELKDYLSNDLFKPVTEPALGPNQTEPTKKTAPRRKAKPTTRRKS